VFILTKQKELQQLHHTISAGKPGVAPHL